MYPTFFDTSAAFRAWFELHHASAAELLVGFYKVDSGRPSMTWSESVDEALCFGWIDGVRRRLDDVAYTIRFTPRRKNSIWSLVNLGKVEVLIAQGRMRPAGMAAFEARSLERSGIYSFEQSTPLTFGEEQLDAFRKQAGAWRFFDALPPGYRRTITFWVLSAKQPATRARRLAQLIQACAEGRRLLS